MQTWYIFFYYMFGVKNKQSKKAVSKPIKRLSKLNTMDKAKRIKSIISHY